MTVFQRVVTMAKRMPAALRSPSMATGWLWRGFSDCQKPNFSSARELDGEEAAVPVGWFDGGEEGGDLFGAVVGEEPVFDEGVDVVELGDFDEEGGTAGGRPVTNSRLPTGARKAAPRPWASCQPLPCSKPRAEKRLVSLSKSALWRDSR